MRLFVLLTFFSVSFYCNSQVLLSETNNSYTQNFGTADITAWTNNSTYLGWYSNKTLASHLSITTTAPTNTGGFYSYECNGDNNQKLGSRPSGSTGTIYYGVRLKNNSLVAIKSLEISYDYFQFSLAENDGNMNTNGFSYRVSATAFADITTGTYTNYTALDFSQKVGDTGGTSAQLNGYPCTQSGTVSSCLAVTIPAGSEIMLRFADVDNSANDHHMGIDNFSVKANEDNVCLQPLPVTLLSFDLNEKQNSLELLWVTSQEKNSESFEVESSFDGQNFTSVYSVKGNETTQVSNSYAVEIEKPIETTYFRLKQNDVNGNYSYSTIKVFTSGFTAENDLLLIPNPSSGKGKIRINVNNSEIVDFKIINAFGQEVSSELIKNTTNYNFFEAEYEKLPAGIYYCIVQIGAKIINKSLLIH